MIVTYQKSKLAAEQKIELRDNIMIINCARYRCDNLSTFVYAHTFI